LILGAGYSAGFIEKHLRAKEAAARIATTSRSKPLHIRFDFLDPASFENIPQSKSAIVTFPVDQIEQANEFASRVLGKFNKTLVISSTGLFKTDAPNAKVTEDSPLDESQARAQAEEILRQAGAVLIHASGIYGPGRDPRAWVSSGRVGRSERLANFIHVEDLCEFLWQANQRANPHSRWIASDGLPLSWSEIIDTWGAEFNLQASESAIAARRESKRIDSSKSIKELGVRLKYSNVLEGVRSIPFDMGLVPKN
jgi:nucleoside-diphosphate-sugar epimerase